MDQPTEPELKSMKVPLRTHKIIGDLVVLVRDRELFDSLPAAVRCAVDWWKLDRQELVVLAVELLREHLERVQSGRQETT